MRTVVAVLACAGALLLAGSAMGGAVAEPGTAPELEPIISAVRQREAKVESIRCVSESKSRMVKESLPDRRSPGWADWLRRDWGLPVKETGLPLEDTFLRNDWRIFLDDGNVRYDKTGQTLNVSTGELVPREHVQMVVEGSSRTYLPKYGSGAENVRPFGGSGIMAFLTAYRLLTTDLAQARADEMRLVGREEYDGHPCVVVEYPYRIPTQPDYVGWPKRVWLAEDMDWSVVRFVTLGMKTEGYPNGTFQYEQDDEGFWRLTGWHLNIDPRGRAMANRVTEFELNVPIDPQVFDFPPGTRVNDGARNMTYVAGGPDDPDREASTDEAP